MIQAEKIEVKMTKSEKNLFSPVDYARTFRRLEKQFENMAQANKPSKRDIIATIAPAGRTLYSAIRSGLLDHLNPPLYLKSETLLPALVDEKKQPKLGNWTPDEYSNYWVFAMQWLPTVPITSVPDNRGLQWKKKKWDKELKKVVEVSYNNEADYIRHLQALSTMYAEACSTVALIVESESADESAEPKQKSKDAKKGAKKNQKSSDKYQLIGALQKLHGIGTAQIRLKPLASKELEQELNWNQPKVHREMKKLFDEKPMQKYKHCFNVDKLTGFMKKLEDGSYDIDGIVESGLP